jgi:hypothetical protein
LVWMVTMTWAFSRNGRGAESFSIPFS